MTDNKYTDEEIIKALDICTQQNSSIPCCDCPCWNDDEQECEVIDDTVILDLINRQRAEIERLKKEVSVARDAYMFIQDRYEHTKIEAYKEFANKLEENCGIFTPLGVNWIEETKVVRVSDIDKILKKMVGKEK